MRHIVYILHSFHKDISPPTNLSKEEFESISNNIAILDKDDYLKSVDELLSESANFIRTFK